MSVSFAPCAAVFLLLLLLLLSMESALPSAISPRLAVIDNYDAGLMSPCGAPPTFCPSVDGPRRLVACPSSLEAATAVEVATAAAEVDDYAALMADCGAPPLFCPSVDGLRRIILCPSQVQQ